MFPYKKMKKVYHSNPIISMFVCFLLVNTVISFTYYNEYQNGGKNGECQLKKGNKIRRVNWIPYSTIFFGHYSLLFFLYIIFPQIKVQQQRD